MRGIPERKTLDLFLRKDGIVYYAEERFNGQPECEERCELRLHSQGLCCKYLGETLRNICSTARINWRILHE